VNAATPTDTVTRSGRSESSTMNDDSAIAVRTFSASA
jgi:hypothetical protein